MVKFHFTNSREKEKHFCTERLVEKYKISKSPLDAHAYNNDISGFPKVREVIYYVFGDLLLLYSVRLKSITKIQGKVLCRVLTSI